MDTAVAVVVLAAGGVLLAVAVLAARRAGIRPPRWAIEVLAVAVGVVAVVVGRRRAAGRQDPPPPPPDSAGREVAGAISAELDTRAEARRRAISEAAAAPDSQDRAADLANARSRSRPGGGGDTP